MGKVFKTAFSRPDEEWKEVILNFGVQLGLYPSNCYFASYRDELLKAKLSRSQLDISSPTIVISIE